MRIAVIGLTPLVRVMVERLAVRTRDVHEFAIWPQRPADIDWSASLGAEKCNTHVAAASGADVVLVTMSSVADLRAVLFGAGQAAAEVACEGACVVDMSGLSLDEINSIRNNLGRRRMHYIVVGMRGDEAAVRAGQLELHLYGTADAACAVAPLLEHITTHLIDRP